MKVRVYHKDGIAFTIHNVSEIIEERKVIIITYKTGTGKEEDYFFNIEEIDTMRIEV